MSGVSVGEVLVEAEKEKEKGKRKGNEKCKGETQAFLEGEPYQLLHQSLVRRKRSRKR